MPCFQVLLVTSFHCPQAASAARRSQHWRLGRRHWHSGWQASLRARARGLATAAWAGHLLLPLLRLPVHLIVPSANRRRQSGRRALRLGIELGLQLGLFECLDPFVRPAAADAHGGGTWCGRFRGR